MDLIRCLNGHCGCTLADFRFHQNGTIAKVFCPIFIRDLIRKESSGI
jgi:hypothetical protein